MSDQEEYDEDLMPLNSDIKFTRKGRGSRTYRTVGTFVLVLILFLLGLCLGLLIGYLAFTDNRKCEEHSETNSSSTVSSNSSWGAVVEWNGKNVSVFDAIGDIMKAENIRSNLMSLTAEPHIASSEQNNKLAEQISVNWQSYGFDEVELVNYTVLLTFPNKSAPNVLTISDRSSSGVIFVANTTVEKPLEPGENNPDVVSPYNAFSAAGTANGTLIYVNYGQQQDFEYLVGEGISFNNSVCIARYGGIFRGDKASLAQKYGCKGLIIYSDPAEYNPYGGVAFPYSWDLPSTGLQRGTLNKLEGDILTPALPSLPGVHRRLYEDVRDLDQVPSIPVQPISYGDAYHFLSLIGGKKAPDDWQGGLNITYNIGPDFGNGSEMVYLEVNNEYANRTIKNVIGRIYGTVEPDKLVLLGNHRDAWVFGGVDPSSGTAVLMEVANVLGQLRGAGWRPGRTLVLCSWDAEEFGLMGSTEWTEDVHKVLMDSALAYLNVDISVQGHDLFRASASPLLYDAIYNATKMVKCPDANFSTVYEQWQHYNKYPGTRPYIQDLGSGSDYTSFLQNLGITSSDFRYVYSDRHYPSYPVYHSVHDTFFWMDQFVDGSFEHHRALGLVWLNVALQISTTPVLPYNVTEYSNFLGPAVGQFAVQYEHTLNQHNLSLTLLNASVDTFSKACDSFEAVLDKARKQELSDNVRRMLNNKLQKLERAFIYSDGLPGRPFFKHLIFAPSAVNEYAGAVFPGVVDALADARTFADWQMVDRQLSLLAVHISYAAQLLDQYIGPPLL